MTAERRDPFVCVECSLPLPVVISQDKNSRSIECAACGARYRGELWKEIPERYQGNARIVEPKK